MALLSGGKTASISSVVSALSKAGIKTDSGQALSVPKTSSSSGSSSKPLANGGSMSIEDFTSKMGSLGIVGNDQATQTSLVNKAYAAWNPTTQSFTAPTNISDIQNFPNFNAPVKDASNPFSGAYNFGMGTMTDVGASSMQGADEKQKSTMDYFNEAYAPDKDFQQQLLKQKQEALKPFETAVQDLKSQITGINAQKDAQQLALIGQGRGITQDLLNTQAAKIDRNAAIKLLPLTAQYQAELGRLESAEKNLTELYGAIVADRQADREYAQNKFQFAYKVATDEQARALKAYEMQKQEEYRNEDRRFDYQMQLSGLFKQANDFKNAGEVMNPNLTEADLAKYSAMVRNLNLIEGQGDAGQEGVGEFIMAGNKQNIQNIDELINSGGMSTAVGTNILSRAPRGILGTIGKVATVIGIPGLFKDAWKSATGQTQDFIAGVEQLQSQLSLDSLINAKAKGATFGALSDTEMRILSASASKIGSYVVKNKEGQAVGYNTTEANFQKELNKINNFAKLDYLLKGGNLEDVGAIQTPDGQVYVKNYDGTLTKLR